jgi:predicted alpha/beta-hydrolase family hydrolase
MGMTKIENFSIPISESIGSVSAEVIMPDQMIAMMALAHGAGADMHHSFMRALADALAVEKIGTLRYNFPYMEKGKSRPDVPAVAEKTVEAILEEARQRFSDVPLLAGGKSFGGRMTSQYFSKKSPSFLRGIVFFGFPLHPAGQPSIDRSAHLNSCFVPMLFLQGTRDALAQLPLIQQVTDSISTAKLILFEGADHSFKAGKKQFITELAMNTSSWFLSL